MRLLQEDFLECKRQRLEGLLAAAGLMLKMLAVDKGLLNPTGLSCCLGSVLLTVLHWLEKCLTLLLYGRLAAELGVVDEGLRQRMHAMFPAAAPPQEGATMDSGAPASSAPPRSNGPLPSLHAVVVQLDSKFITEITHTAALFAELFPPGGRKRLVKVNCFSPHAAHQLMAEIVIRGRAWECRAISLAANFMPAYCRCSCMPLTAPIVCCHLQMCRECFARYLKLTRRALSDASAIAATTAAGITAAGQPIQLLGDLLARAVQAASVDAGYAAAGAIGGEDTIAAGEHGSGCRSSGVALQWPGASSA